MKQDLINGLFELAGGLLLIKNVICLRRDKVVRGVSWIPVSFFTTWGAWNLYYYPWLGQWFSFAGGLLIVIVNCIWLSLVIRYQPGDEQ